MLDRDLATLYGVSTKAFNQAVKRNLNRFPEDFMFQLSKSELEDRYKRHDNRFKDYAMQIKKIFEAIPQLITPLPKKRRPIGFGRLK